jgi:nitrogen fixation/metabolism regulation signal transduction histidine kinase
MPGLLNLIVFFTIPGVLLIFLGISAFSLLSDIIARRPGSMFKARLMAYFTVIVFFSAAPVTLLMGATINEIVRFWNGVNADAAAQASGNFAIDNYSLHLERFENIIRLTNFSRINSDSALPQDIAAVQVFQNSDDEWKERMFNGEERHRLSEPPALERGFVTRELPSDLGIIRYVLRPDSNLLRVISYDLGDEFDSGMAALDNQAAHFEILNTIRDNFKYLLLFYYGAFFFPTLLMTVIIAISFTRRVTYPIVELTEATRRVAEGDFSIQILARRNDELGVLIRSFNAMVQDLERSRAALVKHEKISIWQNMAQQLAHEIKNPLTPIKLSAERVLRRWRNEPESVGDILESSMLAIIQETEGLSTLLNEFRTLSKPMEPSQSWSNLRETIDEITSPYASSYPNVRFSTEYVDSQISIKIEKQRLSQVLRNLIVNAIDAMNGNGAVEMRTDIVKKREVNYCRLSIKDTGKGIIEQDDKLIFTPYYTTKESGTGLGLPIVERIVNDHGGLIWFNSAPGLGTTFFIDLPSG